MILLPLVVTLVYTSAAFADRPLELDCTNCDYSVGGIGYLPVPDNCAEFLQCIKLPNGWIEKAYLCCPEYTRWDQEIKNCVHGDCRGSREWCHSYDTEDGPCPLWADPNNQEKFFHHPSPYPQWCPAGTVFRQMNCTCVHGLSSKKCYDDPLLHFPFAYDFNDIQCPKAAGTPFGNAKIVPNGGYMKLDGDGDYMTFAFLNNYFKHNKPDELLVSLWFKQTDDGYNNVFNIIEGLLSNGHCDQPQTIALYLKGKYIHGIMGGPDAPQFKPYDDTEGDRGYFPPNVWCHVAIRYSGIFREVTLFLNGVPIDHREATWKSVEDIMSDFSVGLAVNECIPHFFTGCIDDVMVFVREVSDAEVSHCIFGNGRTGPHSERMYECPYPRPAPRP